MKRIKIFYLLLIVTTSMIIIGQSVNLLYSQTKAVENYMIDQEKNMELLMGMSVKNRQGVTNMLLNMLINPDVTEMMAEAMNADEDRQGQLRDELYDRMADDYNIIKNIGIYQCQFHLPDNTSFLRLHQPSKYGDSLLEIRQTVNQVIATKQPVVAYEEGRFLGGYRFVYPLFDGLDYVGSVEFSYKMEKVVSPIEATYSAISQLVMDEDEIHEKTNPDFKDIYMPDPYTGLGLINKNLYIDDLAWQLNTSAAALKGLNDKLRYQRLKLPDDQPVMVKYKNDNQLIWVASVPVIDVTGEVVGQQLYYRNDPTLYQMVRSSENAYLSGAITIIVTILMGILIYRVYATIDIKATYDDLTGLYSRRSFMEIMEKNKNCQGVILMLDIDDFKSVNDTYGHSAGDDVLIAIADILKHQIRDRDYAVRWGGEEFMVLMTDADMDTGVKRAETIRRTVMERDIDDIFVTVSIGISQVEEDFQKSYTRADTCLYTAKHNGKNQVCSMQS